MAEVLKIYQKWEDMELRLHNTLKLYPKSERFTLAAQTERVSIEIGTCITRANCVRAKTSKLRNIEKADLLLSELKVLIRMAMKLEFMSIKKWELLSKQIVEIGKMIGGWIKSL